MNEKSNDENKSLVTWPNTNDAGALLGSSLSRRSFVRLAGLVTAGTVLSACGASTAKPSSVSSEKVKLVYQDSASDWFQPMVQEALAQFHDTHPNIEVFYIPEPDDVKAKEEKMLADMQAGTAPDVFQGCCSWFPVWAQNGYTLDLRPYISDLDKDTIEDWDRTQYEAFRTADGAQYGLPKFHGALALYYNKDIFDKARVEYPDGSWTHDDYLDVMRLLTHVLGRSDDVWGSQTYVTWDRIQMHVNGWGGHLMDPNNPAHCVMGEPEAIAAVEWLRTRIWDDKIMATKLDTQKQWPSDAFAAGQLAMVEDGSWILHDILTNSNFRVGVAPFPAGPVRKVTLATNDGFGIYAGTRHPEASWELMKFLISKDYGRMLAKAGFLQPARASLVEEWVQLIRKEMPEKAEGVDIAAFADGHINGYSVMSEVAANMADAARLAEEGWDKILTLGQEPAEYMVQVAAAINATQKSATSTDCPSCDYSA